MGARDKARAPRLRPHAAACGRVLVGGAIAPLTAIAWRANRKRRQRGRKGLSRMNGILPASRAPATNSTVPLTPALRLALSVSHGE